MTTMFLFATLETEPVSQKGSWMVENKPVNFVSSTVVSLYHFQNYWNFDFEYKYAK